MIIHVTEEFRNICLDISSQRKSDEEWAAVESDDMFQSGSFIGGFDATEMAFCFSYFDAARSEYWFQLTREEVAEVAAGRRTSIDARTADK